MKKIIDNSVISAVGRNIKCVELMPILQEHYSVVVPQEVVEECWNYEAGRLIPLIETTEIVKDPRIAAVSAVIKQCCIPLGKGEISCIATSLVLTADGVLNYLVLDDGRARKIVDKIGEIPEIQRILGKTVILNYTGTVGLVKHLFDIGAITRETRQKICFELENSDFRINKNIVRMLR